MLVGDELTNQIRVDFRSAIPFKKAIEPDNFIETRIAFAVAAKGFPLIDYVISVIGFS